jgi:hypothetical protein
MFHHKIITPDAAAPVASPGSDPDPASQTRERKITIQFRPPEVSEAEIQVIAHCWSSHVPIQSITRRIQAPRCKMRKPPLIYVDIYSILYILQTQRIISQRNTHQHELTIQDFGQFFRLWKEGRSFKQCLIGLRDRPIGQCTEFANQVYRSICDRWRKEQKAFDPVAAAARATKKKVSSGNITADFSHLLELAVRRKVENREAIVIFIDQIPLGMLQLLRKMPDGIKYVEGIHSGQDFFNQILESSLPDLPKGMMNTNVMNEHKDQSTSAITTAFKTISEEDIINQDLKVLDPTGSMESQAAENLEIAELERESRRKLRLRSSDISVESDNPVPAGSPPAAPMPEMSDDADLEGIFADLDEAAERSKSAAESPTSVTDLTLDNLADDDPL